MVSLCIATRRIDFSCISGDAANQQFPSTTLSVSWCQNVFCKREIGVAVKMRPQFGTELNSPYTLNGKTLTFLSPSQRTPVRPTATVGRRSVSRVLLFQYMLFSNCSDTQVQSWDKELREQRTARRQEAAPAPAAPNASSTSATQDGAESPNPDAAFRVDAGT